MAINNSTLYRIGQRRGQFEAVRGYGPDRTRQALKTDDRAKAEAIIADMNARVITGGQTSVSSVLALYRHHLGGKWNRHHARSESRIETFFGQKDISEVTPRTCRQYTSQRERDGMSANTIRLELNHLRAAAKHAYREEVIEIRPSMELPTSHATRDRWLDRSEFDALLAHARSDHLRLYLMLAVVTAARPSHILALTWPQIDMDRMLINFRKAGERQSNKRKPIVPMTATVRDMLFDARDRAQTDHVIEYRGSPVASIDKGIEIAARRAGLANVSPYVLRHTAGTWMAMAGVSLLEIAERMGHASVDTTRKHYLHFQPEFMSASTVALDITLERDSKWPLLKT